jgi:predicted PhzF superfamily epimerase YddE/YHI9
LPSHTDIIALKITIANNSFDSHVAAHQPYWADRLGRKQLRARQVSARGGEIECVLENNRVELKGGAVLVLEGRLRF